MGIPPFDYSRYINDTMTAITRELVDATNKHGAFHSAHEGYAVILEEVDELWADVKANLGYDDCALKEAIQIAAMAARYVVDMQVIRATQKHPPGCKEPRDHEDVGRLTRDLKQRVRVQA